MWVDKVFTSFIDQKHTKLHYTRRKNRYCLLSQIKDHADETADSLPEGKLGSPWSAAADCFPLKAAIL